MGSDAPRQDAVDLATHLGYAWLPLTASKLNHHARVPALRKPQATKLIMAHMSKEPYEVTAWPLVLMAVQVGTHRDF